MGYVTEKAAVTKQRLIGGWKNGMRACWSSMAKHAGFGAFVLRY
jgi:hypothetical protein